MRLTNPSDQQYVRRLIPDNINAITDTLPILEKQEALILGDSIIIPTIVKIKELKDKPSSNDILFKTEWQRDWLNFTFTPIINKLKKVGTKDICEEIKS